MWGKRTHALTQKCTNVRALTGLKRTNAHIQPGGNGLAALNKCNHCDLNERQSRSDVLKCASLCLSPPFSINLSSLHLHLVSVCAGITLESHSSAPSLLFPPHYSLFFHICISLSSPSFIVFFFFFYLQCLFLFVFDPCAGTSQPVTLLLWAWRVEMTPELWGSDLSLFLSTLSSSLIYPHSLAFSSLNISSSRGRPQRGH